MLIAVVTFVLRGGPDQARLGQRTAAAMAQIDAAFPGRVVGAQILHGVTYEGNYPAAWSAASVEGLPVGSYDNMYPDYSPDTAAAFCGSSGSGSGPGGAAAASCIVPTAADRDNATHGNTLISADTPVGNASTAFNRYINVRMAAGIAAVGDSLKLLSSGKAFVTTLYGAIYNGASVSVASGGSAETELLQMTGVDGIGNPPLYTPEYVFFCFFWGGFWGGFGGVLGGVD